MDDGEGKRKAREMKKEEYRHIKGILSQLTFKASCIDRTSRLKQRA
jgi:hypothetical protein